MRGWTVLAVGLVTVVGLGAQQGTRPAGAGQSMGQGPGSARPLPAPIAEVQTMYDALKTNITKAADQFPEDKYGWSPTPDVRTWGGLLSHIIDDNNGACWALSGETAPPPKPLDSNGKPTEAGMNLTKATIVSKLNDSFALCDKAFGALTPETMFERASPTSNRSKLGLLIYDTQHISEHWGNVVTYMRLQNLVPPSTAARMGRGRGGQ